MKLPQWNSLWAAVSLLALLVSTQSAQATSETWSAGTSGNWATAGNWNSGAGPAPGATSGSTTNPDTATFSSSTGVTVTVDTGRNIENITFGSLAGTYTLTGGSLVLTSGGTIQTSAIHNEVVNSNITLEGGYTFSSQGATTTLNTGGTIAGDTGLGALTLTLNATNSTVTTANTISGVISDTAGTGTTLGITKTGAGTWVFSNTDTYSGATTINGGILTLSGAGRLSNSAVTVNNAQLAITDTASGSITRAGNVTLNGGAVQVNGTSTGSTTDTISTLTLGPGAYTTDNLGNTSSTHGVGNGNNTVFLVPNSATNSTLVIGNLVTTTGGTIEFGSSSTMGASTIGATVNDGDVQINSINGGTVASALVGGGGALSSTTTSILPFAVGASANSDTPTGLVTYSATNGVQLLTTYLTGSLALSGISGTTSTNNVLVSATDNISADTTINSLSINAGNITVSLNSHTLSVTSGAVFLGPSNSYFIGAAGGTAGTLQLGTGGAAFIQVPQGRVDVFNAAITGPGLSSGTGSLTINGAQSGSASAGTIIFAGANNYTGGTIVNGGSGPSSAGIGLTLQIGGASATTAGATGTLGSGSGNLVLNNAALAYALTVSQSVSNNISGSGTVQLRAADTGMITLSGTNTYTGTTTINGGTLSVATLNSVSGGSSSSNLGAPITVANGTIGIGSTTVAGKLVDTGTGETTDRVINLAGTTGGATIDQSGTGLLKFTSAFTATGVGSKTLTLQGSTAGTGEIAGAIVDNLTGTNTTALTKSGTGAWTLTGANTYTGATTVSSGTLALSGSGSLAGTAVAVNSTGTLQINGNRSIGTSGVASVTVNSGGTLSLVDGTINTLTLNTTSGSSLVMGGGGTLAFDLGATSDQILLSSGTASVTGNTTVTITSLGGLTGSTQTLISAPGGGLGTTGFTLGGITGSTGSYTLSLNETNNDLFLNENASGAVTAAFWSGANGSAWNTTSPTTNFNTDLSSGTPTTALPTSVTNVTFTATGASNASATTLGQDFTINSLTFNTAGVGIGGSNTLTILAGTANGHTMGDGITSSGSGTNTISSAVALGSSQTWTVNTGNTLAVSGQVSDGGSAYSLTTAGAGKLSLTNSTGNTYTGGTTVGGTTTLFIGNTSGSATGSGALAVLKGAALAGTGTSSGSSFAIGATGSGTAHIYVGQSGATGDTNVTSNLTLKGGSGLNNSTIANANLTFNLNTNSAPSLPGQGNELLVGNTGIAFGSAVTLTLNLQGSGTAANVPYFVLIAGTAGTSGPGQDGSQYTGLSLGTSFSSDGGTLTPILNSSVGGSGNLVLALDTTNYTGSGFYGGNSGLFLFQTAGGIDDIVVIPEPSTWALMLGGLTVLVFIQRSRRKKV